MQEGKERGQTCKSLEGKMAVSREKGEGEGIWQSGGFAEWNTRVVRTKRKIQGQGGRDASLHNEEG